MLLSCPATAAPASASRSATARPIPRDAPVTSATLPANAPVMRTKGNVVELVPMQWSFPASRPGARPVFNFRGEGRKFRKDDRVIIPASGFYEFTGAKSPKNKWLFTLNDAPMMGIAGIWRLIGGKEMFTMLTVDPGPDLEGFHDRQVVVLPPRDCRPGSMPMRPSRI